MNMSTFKFADANAVKPFKIDIPFDKIESIRERMADAVLPKQMPVSEGATSFWETGMDIEWLDSLRNTWVNEYQWEPEQEWLNKYPQFMADVGDAQVHFYHIQGEGPNPKPLLLIHGWPGSVCEFLDIADSLANPSRHGGKAEDAFSLVIPSLPGFGFSSMPKAPVNAISTAKLFHRLMVETIGYKKYFAQGGDFGGGVAVSLAYQFPESVRGIHINFTPWFPIPVEDRTPEEEKWLVACDDFITKEFDYVRLQANKTMMPAVALKDSPIGTAAWISEKFWAWTDHRGSLDSIIPRTKLITNIMIYLVNEHGIDGSFWFYRAFRDEQNWTFFPGYVSVPTAIAAFPKEYPQARPSRETASRGFNVTHYTKMPSGGHFASLEEPVLLIDDIQSAFKGL